MEIQTVNDYIVEEKSICKNNSVGVVARAYEAGQKSVLKVVKPVNDFYANEENWMQTINGIYNLGKIWIEVKDSIPSEITLECGERAREIKEELEKIG